MKNIILLILIISIISCKENSEKEEKLDKGMATTETASQEPAEDIYQFKVKTLSEEDFDFSSLKGKKVMIVNTASKCGLTPQYKDLQSLYDTYKNENFVIVGFPANNFAKQEPGTNAEIAEFCQLNYDVSFPMMAKISVKGKDMHPLYQFLTQKSKNRFEDSEVSWNFQKYLIDEQGNLVQVITPKTLPTDESIVGWIKG